MPVKVEFVDPKELGTLDALSELLNRILGPTEGANGDTRQAADHPPDTACNCADCQIQRFQVPAPPNVDDKGSLLGLLGLLASAAKQAANTAKAAKQASIEFVLNPPPRAAEDILLQMYVDRTNAAVRAFKALVALMPETHRPAIKAPDAKTLEQAQAMMANARVQAQKTFDEHRAAAEAKAAAAAAVDAAASGAPATPTAGGEG